MKNLIITAGALLLIITVIGFQMECNQLLRQKQDLKFMADEAAASAGLCIEPYDFGEGELVFDQEKAIAVAQGIVKQNMPGKEVNTQVFFMTAEGERTTVTVTVTWDNLIETSTYEYVAY